VEEAARKSFGAYYTEEKVAKILSAWAIRRADDRVCDPSAGDGAFLLAAAQRLEELGGSPKQGVFGVELNGATRRVLLRRLECSIPFPPPAAQIREADFFSVTPGKFGPFEAIVGNPPFIRYHRFKDSARAIAFERMEDLGLELTERASAWAPFVAHACEFLAREGRAAWVVPMELLFAAYARPLLRYLGKEFGAVHVVVFRHRTLFPDLGQNTVLLLCDGFGTGPGSVYLHDVESLRDLPSNLDVLVKDPGRTRLPDSALGNPSVIRSYLLPQRIRLLYEALSQRPRVARLGDVLSIDIGYVTGSASFFHLSEDDVHRLKLPTTWLLPALRRGRDVRGLRLQTADWLRMKADGVDCYLLHPPRKGRVPKSVRRYLNSELGRTTRTAYKCRVRDPWWQVPLGRIPEAFLLYGQEGGARLVANAASIWASNAVHIGWRKETCSIPLRALASTWMSSLSRLSIELEAYPLGGGLLKLDVGAAENTLVVLPAGRFKAGFSEAVDRCVRRRDWKAAREIVDSQVLRSVLGLTAQEIALLQEGADQLQELREHRPVPGDPVAEQPSPELSRIVARAVDDIDAATAARVARS